MSLNHSSFLQFEILSKVSVAVTSGATNGLAAPSASVTLPSSFDAAPLMALIPPSTGARSQVIAVDGGGLAGPDVTVEVTAAPALENDLGKVGSIIYRIKKVRVMICWYSCT